MGDLQPYHVLILLFLGLCVVLPFWQICKKAGFAPQLSLLLFIPFLGVVVLFVVAFSKWKVVPTNSSSAAEGVLDPTLPETKFCSECGQKIKRRAEICPLCGCRQTQR